jgi:hypothetical protein
MDLAQRIKDDIIELALVEGEKGLWEPLWEFRSSDQFGHEANLAKLVERALRELYAEDRLEFFRRNWEDGEEGNRHWMEAAEVEAELAADWWKEVPLNRGDVWFMARGHGDQKKRRLPG